MKKALSAIVVLIAAFIYAQGTDCNATINIDSRVKYQHVSGFGGLSPSPQWQYWLNNTQMDKLFGKGEKQLGLNIVRLYIANNKSGWSAGVANAKRAKQRGAFIFASPWSPPAEWKSNGSDSNGGELLESHWEDWANFLNDYYKYMKAQGVEIDAVSIQNEPDWNTSYQSCIWTGEKMAKFLKEYGHLIECKIIAPEAVHFTPSMHEPILNDPEACEQLDILGGHFYGWNGSSYPLAAQKGKEVWMTEYLINERQQNEGHDINWCDDGFLFARSINDAMLANMSAWVHYSLKRYYGCLGDGTYGTDDNVITKRGYILSHYAKYVSGSTRVRHALYDESCALSSSAYLSATGDSIVVMVLNPSDDSYAATINLPFYSCGGREIVTTETLNMKKTDLEYDETYRANVEVLPWSVSTYVFEKSSDREDMGDDTPIEGLVYSDEFDMAGASCIPAGWRVKYEDGTRYSGQYSLGPRIMAFSPEGLMQYALYFRTNTTAMGYAAYGQEADYRLALEPGSYRLTFSTAGWKGLPSVTALVLRSGTTQTTIAKTDGTPEYWYSENGPSSRITQTSDFTLDFEVSEADNYVLRWNIAKAESGLNEALLGNIRLIRIDPDGTIDVMLQPDEDDAIYDLVGRRVLSNPSPGIYIKNGKKLLLK